MRIKDMPSPSFGERADSATPSYIIMHYTDMKTAQEALDRLCDPAAEVSAHYTIDEGGTVYRHVGEDKRAWHAGKSYWRGITDMNSHSIGIELVNPGHSHGYREFPRTQMEALADLAQDIMARHAMPPENVLGHSDIAPGRKVDPGHLFDWRWLALRGIGVWPEEAAPYRGGLKEELVRIGYDPACEEETLVTAFQRHFEPEVYEQGQGGAVSTRTRKRLGGLPKT